MSACTGAPGAGLIHEACGQKVPGVIVTPGVIGSGTPPGVTGTIVTDDENPGEMGIMIPGERGIPGENRCGGRYEIWLCGG